jgi:IS1 family transposase
MEGVSIAAIARLEGISWNTAARWLERAASVAAAFQDAMTWELDLLEVQADEIRTFAPGKRRPLWIYTTMEVSSRLWPVLRVGRRGHKATMRVMREVAGRGRPAASPLVATDGYRYYKPAVRIAFGRGCAFGQVIKTRRKDRVVRVERRIPLCTRRELEDAIEQSEDSSTLNTSFIERLNLTVRQGSAYLGRRTAAHARSSQHLLAHLELFRCYYNFMRPHSALRFGREVRTPAQQAGLVSRRLDWADILVRKIAAVLRTRILRPGFSGSRLSWAA